MAGGVRVNQGQSYSSMERAAATIRSVLVPGIKVTAELPCMELFERIDKFRVKGPDGRIIPLTYGVKEYPEGVDGLTRYEEDENRIVVNLSTRIYEMLEQNHPRAKFALAHELGHAALHPAELVRLAEIPHSKMGLERSTGHPQYLDSEWQANSLAAALLMPAAGLPILEAKGLPVTPALLQAVYGVSAQAAEIRMKVFRERRSELL